MPVLRSKLLSSAACAARAVSAQALAPDNRPVTHPGVQQAVPLPVMQRSKHQHSAAEVCERQQRACHSTTAHCSVRGSASRALPPACAHAEHARLASHSEGTRCVLSHVGASNESASYVRSLTGCPSIPRAAPELLEPYACGPFCWRSVCTSGGGKASARR